MVDVVLASKYREEIDVLKKVLLEHYEVRDEELLDILRFSFFNTNASEKELEEFALKLPVNLEVVKRVFNAFNRSKELNHLNFELPRYILRDAKMLDDNEVIDNILEVTRSKRPNFHIFDKLSIVDLISKEAMPRINNFFRAFIFRGKMGERIEGLKRELQNDFPFALAEVRLKIPHSEKFFKEIDEFKRCYVKVIYPFVSMHDTETMRSIATIRLENVELKYVGL